MKPIAKADNENLEALYKFFGSFSKDVLDLAESTFKEKQPEFLAEFQQSPPVRRWPADYPGHLLPFDTEKQRRWYWANVGAPHTRTGRMAQNLKQDIEREGNVVRVVAKYPSASTKYVIGNIMGEAVESYQQRFHKATGWQEAAPKLERHAQSYYDTFVRRYEAFVVFK